MAAFSREDWETALAAAGAVTLELMAAGALEVGAPWAPVNAVAPLLLSPDAAERRNWDAAAAPVGLAILVAGLGGWGLLHSRLRRALSGAGAPLGARPTALALLSAAALALFDFRLLPPARRPRLRRWLSPAAVAAKYALFAAVLALRGSDR